MDTTTQLYINPYQASAGLGTIELQILLLGAIGCFAMGLLLAEAHTLRRIRDSLDRALKLKRPKNFALSPEMRQSP